LRLLAASFSEFTPPSLRSAAQAVNGEGRGPGGWVVTVLPVRRFVLGSIKTPLDVSKIL
jgi:hypothetical protein